MEEAKQTTESNDHSQRDLLIAFSLGFAMSLFYLWAFYPALSSGFTLIDDSTINASVLKWLNGDESIFGILYRPDMQGGARYTPTFWIIKATLHSVFGYQPAFHHAFHLFMIWTPVVMLPLLAGIRYRLPCLVCLPLPLFILSSGNGWSHNLWNVYDVSTFDPYAGGFLALSVIFLERILSCKLNEKKNILWFILFFLSLLFLVHSKETIAIGTLGCAVLLAISAFIFRSRKKTLLILSAASFIAVGLFFFGFFTSGAYGASKVDEYTSNYQIDLSIIFQNAVFTFNLLLRELGWILLLAVLLLCMRAFTLFIRNQVPNEMDLIILGCSAVFCSFTAAVLPTSNLSELPRLLFIPYIALCLLISLSIVSIPSWLKDFSYIRSEKIRKSLQYILFFLFLSPLVLVFPKAISYRNFYPTVLGAEWNSVLWAEEQIKNLNDDQILNIVTPDAESMYWGLCIHLNNMGIEPYSKTEMIPINELEPNKISKPILIISRNGQKEKIIELGYKESDLNLLYPDQKSAYYGLNFANLILMTLGKKHSAFTAQPVSSPIIAIED